MQMTRSLYINALLDSFNLFDAKLRKPPDEMKFTKMKRLSLGVNMYKHGNLYSLVHRSGELKIDSFERGGRIWCITYRKNLALFWYELATPVLPKKAVTPMSKSYITRIQYEKLLYLFLWIFLASTFTPKPLASGINYDDQLHNCFLCKFSDCGVFPVSIFLQQWNICKISRTIFPWSWVLLYRFLYVMWMVILNGFQ